MANSTTAQITYEDFVRQQLTVGKTPFEIIFKFLTIQIATMVAYGHLNSLRQQPENVQVQEFIWFLLLPLFPLAQIVVGCYRTYQRSRTLPRAQASWQYYLACALGSRAVPHVEGHDARSQGPSIPVILLDPYPQLLYRHTSPRKMQWFCRLVVLVCFLTQDFTMIFNYFRRPDFTSLASDLPRNLYLTRFGEHTPLTRRIRAGTDIEIFSINFAIGAFFAALASLCLSASNWTWTYSRLLVRNQAKNYSDDSFLGSLPGDPPGDRRGSEIVIAGVFSYIMMFLVINIAMAAMVMNLTPGFPLDADNPWLMCRIALLLWLSIALSFLYTITYGSVLFILHDMSEVAAPVSTASFYRFIVAYGMLIVPLFFIPLWGIIGVALDIDEARSCWRNRDQILENISENMWMCDAIVLWKDPNEGRLWSF
jgi:hypothetical protein